MPITTTTGVSGFIASTPKLSISENGVARVYAKIGQEHSEYNPETDVYEKTPTTFGDMVAFRGTAERIAARFAKGDWFIAEGKIKTQTAHFDDGHTEQHDEFQPIRIGHDLAMTRYQIDRAPRVQQGPDGPTCPAGPTNQDLVPPADTAKRAGRTPKGASL